MLPVPSQEALLLQYFLLPSRCLGQFLADWYKIEEHRQSLADCSNMHEIKGCIDYDYKIGDQVLIAKDSILCKSESKFGKEPWTITMVHTNGTIRVQSGTKLE